LENTNDKKNPLKEITDRLEQGIKELFESERYRNYLNVMSKFHEYSINNMLLIAMQNPQATLIAGFNAWKKNFGRFVKRGEKSIKIIAPAPYKIKKNEDSINPETQKPIIGKDGKPVTETIEITIPAFKVVSVFDISQTEGKPLPGLDIKELTGDVNNYATFFNALKEVSPFPIDFENITDGAKGYCNFKENRIAIREDLSEAQTIKTAIHEITHAKLHNYYGEKEKNVPIEQRKNRNTKEVEAESVAYTVCQHYGIDTSDYSFTYIASWSTGRNLDELKNSLETIRTTAAELITDIDIKCKEITQQHAMYTSKTDELEQLSKFAIQKKDEIKEKEIHSSVRTVIENQPLANQQTSETQEKATVFYEPISY